MENMKNEVLFLLVQHKDVGPDPDSLFFFAWIT